MKRNRTRKLLLAALLAPLPILVLAGVAPTDLPPLSKASCCNLGSAFTTSLFPGGNGDEGFFGLPVGVPPNAMILLDTSTSMLDFPVPLSLPDAASKGCNNPTLSAVVPSDTPYDDGTESIFIVDSPPWGLRKCAKGKNNCLFFPTSYYKFSGNFLSAEWSADYAREYTQTDACSDTGDATACAACLDSEGYYLFRSGGAYRGRFTGAFLNGYPPKFVIARKVLKDIVTINPEFVDDATSARFGLAVFTTGSNSGRSSGLRANDGAKLVVPLGPNCTMSENGYQKSYDTVVGAYKEARQKIIDAVNDKTQVSYSNTTITYTPLAESLFNLGQYFSDNQNTIGSQDGPVYDYMFGPSWALPSTTVPGSSFRERAGGTVNAPWVNVSGQRQASVCWACQQSSVVVITDGMPTNDGNLPKYNMDTSHVESPTPRTPDSSNTNDFPRWNHARLTDGCPGCVGQNLQKVADFLYQNDLRPDLSNAKQTQTVTTYAVSFGIDDAGALGLLRKTASLGGGDFYNTASGDELRNALQSAVGDTVARATSFSVSNTNTLQTGSANQLFLARFRKLLSPSWEGHLHRFRVFNEYVEGCRGDKKTADQTQVACEKRGGTTKPLNPNLNEDVAADGNAACDGLFIIDAECDPVAEDENGDFRKARLVRNADGTGSFVASSSDPGAVPFWDAGDNLSYATFPASHPDPTKAGQANAAYRSADEGASNKRKIYTVLDTDGDGRFSAADQRIPFETTWAKWLAPYLELNGLVHTGDPSATIEKCLGDGTCFNVCTSILQRAGACGGGTCPVPDTATGQVGDADLESCAKQVIHWVRGWDVFDDDGDGCGGPGNPSNSGRCPDGKDGEERNRENDRRPDQQFWKLGDVFHSSPVLVKPPATQMVCDLGLENQCVATLHSPQFGSAIQTPAGYDVDGDGDVGPGENAYEKYRVDHAKRRQVVLVGANDGMLHAFDAGAATSDPPDWLGTYQFTRGTGAELWAFIPPDLLPKLKLAIDDHQYFVDGNTMVRDVWVDDNRDGKKQPGEYRTMAVLSERSGGSQYVGLDVTDTTSPVFRWSFPENCTLDQNVFGQTWSGFAPRPPPIGPVKLAIGSGGPADPTRRGFEERWIVMVNGGYDPTLTRGRGVWMLDVFTGERIWRFTDDENKDLHGADANMWSVPAAVGMVDIGDADEALLDADGFFDTATWGDMGGQLFVARFQEPGRIASGEDLVGNWYAARAFEERRQSTDAQEFEGRTEFFHMTANAIDLDRGYLHSYLGGGSREHLLQVGAACGPGNVLGCCQAGCGVEMYTHYNYDSCNVTNHVKCSNGKMVQDKTTANASCDGSYACGKLTAKVEMKLQCGPAGNPADIIAHLNCDAEGNCSARQMVKDGKVVDLEKLTAPTWHGRFYGILSYGGQKRTFSDSAGAVKLDENRFTDIDYGAATTCSGGSCKLIETTYATVNSAGAVSCPSGVTQCSATGDDPGWFYEYGRKCPTGTSCDDPLPWLDEKTASGATILAGCVDWNTFRPRGRPASTLDPCATTNSAAARNYTYLADFVSGAPTPSCGFFDESSSTYARARQRSTIAPPPDPTQLVAINMDGQVKYVAAQIEPGGTPATASLGSEREMVQPAYWLELNREAHVCRHVEPNVCR